MTIKKGSSGGVFSNYAFAKA